MESRPLIVIARSDSDDVSAEARRAKAEAIHSAARGDMDRFRLRQGFGGHVASLAMTRRPLFDIHIRLERARGLLVHTARSAGEVAAQRRCGSATQRGAAREADHSPPARGIIESCNQGWTANPAAGLLNSVPLCEFQGLTKRQNMFCCAALIAVFALRRRANCIRSLWEWPRWESSWSPRGRRRRQLSRQVRSAAA